MRSCALGRGEETRVLEGRDEPLDGDIAVCVVVFELSIIDGGKGRWNGPPGDR